MSKKSFIVYLDYAEFMEDLTDEEVGQMFRAMLQYETDGTEPTFDDRCVRTVWRKIKANMDDLRREWENALEARRENGKKGGRPKKAEVSTENLKNQQVFEKTEKTERFLEKPKKADTVNVTVTDTVNVNDTVVVADATTDNGSSIPSRSEQTVELVENYMNRPLATGELSIVTEWESPPELISYAINKAEEKSIFKVSYIDAILRSWKDNGIDTVDKAQAEFKSRDKPKPPEPKGHLNRDFRGSQTNYDDDIYEN